MSAQQYRWRPAYHLQGLRVGATNGLVSGLSRLFLSKHDSRRSNAIALLSSGTRSVAPSPLTSRTFDVRSRSLKAPSANAIVTPVFSANALASAARAPDTNFTV